jgi:hypothetical protein
MDLTGNRVRDRAFALYAVSIAIAQHPLLLDQPCFFPRAY